MTRPTHPTDPDQQQDAPEDPLQAQQPADAIETAETAGDALPIGDTPAAETLADEAQPDAAPTDAATGAPTDDEKERLEELLDSGPTVDEEAIAQAKDEEDEEPPADISEVEEESESVLERLAAKSRRLSEEQVRHVVHSLLFVADRPLTVDHLRHATGLEPKRIRAALDELSGELREGVSGVVLSEIAGGWQLRTAPESGEYVRRFLKVKPRRLTRAALETLAIIAYRQPVTRPEIEDIRGVDSGAVVKALLEWKLIKILGKKDEIGRPILYGTSREFLEFFQLKDLSSLPTLREFQELSEESREIVEEELGTEAVAGIEGTVAELMDPAYVEAEKERMEKSEAALAELEQAMADADDKAQTVTESLQPQPPPQDPEGE